MKADKEISFKDAIFSLITDSTATVIRQKIIPNVLEDNKDQIRTLHSAKIFLQNKGKTKIFSYKKNISKYDTSGF